MKKETFTAIGLCLVSGLTLTINIDLLSKQVAQEARHQAQLNIGAGAEPPNPPPEYVPTCDGCKKLENKQCTFSNGADGNLLGFPCQLSDDKSPPNYRVSCERQEAFAGAYNVSFNLYTDVREEDIPCAVKAYIECAKVQGNGSTGAWKEAAPPYGICGMKASCEEVAPAVYDHENCKKIKE